MKKLTNKESKIHWEFFNTVIFTLIIQRLRKIIFYNLFKPFLIRLVFVIVIIIIRY